MEKTFLYIFVLIFFFFFFLFVMCLFNLKPFLFLFFSSPVDQLFFVIISNRLNVGTSKLTQAVPQLMF